MQTTNFPKIAADMGGAEYVRFGARVAEIKLPGREAAVRVQRSRSASLHAETKSTAFTLADAELRGRAVSKRVRRFNARLTPIAVL